MKLRYKVLIILSLILSVNILNADCDSASKSGIYLMADVERALIKTDTNVVNVLLYDEETYLEVTNDYDDSVLTYYKSDVNEDGFININSPDSLTNIKYTISLKYVDKTCGEGAIKTIELETGIYNINSDKNICLDKLYLDVCKNNYAPDEIDKYFNINTNKKLEEEVKKELEEYNNPDNNLKNIIKEYYLYVLLPFLFISLIYIIRIIIIKRRGKQHNGE